MTATAVNTNAECSLQAWASCIFKNQEVFTFTGSLTRLKGQKTFPLVMSLDKIITTKPTPVFLSYSSLYKLFFGNPYFSLTKEEPYFSLINFLQTCSNCPNDPKECFTCPMNQLPQTFLLCCIARPVLLCLDSSAQIRKAIYRSNGIKAFAISFVVHFCPLSFQQC